MNILVLCVGCIQRCQHQGPLRASLPNSAFRDMAWVHSSKQTLGNYLHHRHCQVLQIGAS